MTINPIHAEKLERHDLPNRASHRLPAEGPLDMGERYNSATPGLAPSRLAGMELRMSTPEIQNSVHLELRRFIDHVPALGWSALPDGSLNYVNQRFESTRGFLWTSCTDRGGNQPSTGTTSNRSKAGYRNSFSPGTPVRRKCVYAASTVPIDGFLFLQTPSGMNQAGSSLGTEQILTSRIESRQRQPCGRGSCPGGRLSTIFPDS